VIFKETWRWVLDKSPHTGEPKTQTRRRGKRKYKVGGIYAVQPGRGKTGKGFIRILDSWEERVPLFPAGLNIEKAHRFARAEGFLDVGHFWSLWTKLYGALCGL
jgi:hypothetical protein